MSGQGRSPQPPHIVSANLEWRDGQPLSRTFGDVYFSRDDGLAESRHVFIDGNNLRQRWQSLAPDRDFVIMETGFGTGLNFLAATGLWLDLAPARARLHFVSLEKYPMNRGDLARALTPWGELAPLARELIAAYPPLVPGFHRRWLCTGRVSLTLILDDAVHGLESLAASDHPAFHGSGNPRADAWFLDGFAPARNPDLWSPELFRQVARFSGAGTTVSSFTVARQVRDGLAQVGFRVERATGFGRKREMLRAEFSPDSTATTTPPATGRGTSEPPWHLPPPAHRGARSALVIGAGIAGCATAAALRVRGWQVALVDRHPLPGGEASGNPQGILYPKLSVEDQPLSAIGRHALCHAMDYYRQLWQTGGLGDPCGVLVLPTSDKDREQFPRIAERHGEAQDLVRLVRNKELEALAGVPLAADLGLWHAGLGWVCPPRVCRELARGSHYLQGEVSALQWCAADGQWLALDGDDNPLASAPVVVVACAQGTAGFPQTARLPLRRIRGQVSAFATTPLSQQLKTVICGAGYVAPALEGLHTLGATYDLDDGDTTLRDSDHDRNLATLAATDPALAALFREPAATGRAALRCTTPDYLPVAGPAPRFDDFVECFAPLRRNARADFIESGPCWPGLWINAGHGSRGLTHAPLTAELIAGQICGEPAALPRDLARALHPGRFIIRALKRNLL